MRKKSFGKIALAVGIGVAGVGGSLSVQAPAYAQEVESKIDYENQARAFLDYALKSDWESLSKYFNEKLQAALPKEMLAGYWAGNTANFGKIKSTSLKEVKYNGVHTRVTFTVNAELSPYELYLNLDNKGKIDDLSVSFPEFQYTSPTYDHPENYTEKEVIIGEGDFSLPGLLTIPKGKGPFPVVVLVHGSGAHDMDESYYGFKPFRDLAVGLANEGIAVLRYEKRTKTHPFKTGSNPKGTMREETILDANLAVKKLTSIPEIDAKNIYVLGHSQGGLALPLILENDKDGDIKGGIVAAGPADKFQDLLLWQNEQLLERAKQAKAPKEQIDALEGNLAFWKEQIGLINNPLYSAENPPPNFKLGSLDWWFYIRDLIAPEIAKEQDVPLFVFQGGKDFQVPATQLEGWKSALKEREDVQYKLYPNMQHFLVDNAKATGSLADYNTPGNVPEQLVADLSQWVKTGVVEEKPEVDLSQYKDYQDNQYWSVAFSWAIQEGIIKGYQHEKLLKPNSALNEIQYLKIFFRYTLNGALKDESSENLYALAKKEGLSVKGKPSEKLSLGEAAVLLSKSISNKELSEKEAVQWLNEHHILDGIVADTSTVNKPITRAQFVTILQKIDEANLLDR
ncbi:serine aminopeptidase domain-containing protein [Ureibacillus yapensis]|nr:alpha/beta hydrolase [Lysinibacillus yapensis]